MKRICYIHVGTFKTGTSAIQQYLAQNASALARRGLYIPLAGRRSNALPGHHNLASELLGNADFDRRQGGFTELVREIESIDSNVCLSSETFGLCYCRPSLLERLKSTFDAAGFALRIVVYVRAQPDYLEALFSEGMKHGYVETVSLLADEVVANGSVERRGQRISFDYAVLARGFADVFGRDGVRMAGYRNIGGPGRLVADFLEIVGVAPECVRELAFAQAYVNARLTTGGVIERLFANAGAVRDEPELAQAGMRYAASRPDLAAVPFAPLSPAERARLAERFSQSNAAVVREWNVPASTFADAAPAESERTRDARAFFQAAQSLVTGVP